MCAQNDFSDSFHSLFCCIFAALTDSLSVRLSTRVHWYQCITQLPPSSHVFSSRLSPLSSRSLAGVAPSPSLHSVPACLSRATPRTLCLLSPVASDTDWITCGRRGSEEKGRDRQRVLSPSGCVTESTVLVHERVYVPVPWYTSRARK